MSRKRADQARSTLDLLLAERKNLPPTAERVIVLRSPDAQESVVVEIFDGGRTAVFTHIARHGIGCVRPNRAVQKVTRMRFRHPALLERKLRQTQAALDSLAERRKAMSGGQGDA